MPHDLGRGGVATTDERDDLLAARRVDPGVAERPGEGGSGGDGLEAALVAAAAGDVVGAGDPDVSEVAGWVSPNPGGVGPMTRAMLLTNIVEAAERAAGTARAS